MPTSSEFLQKFKDRLRALDTRKRVIQGPYHRDNIISMFKEIINAAQEEFTEDNEPTLVSFLDECYREAKAGAFPQDYMRYLIQNHTLPRDQNAYADLIDLMHKAAAQVAEAPPAEPIKLLNRFEILKEK